VYSAQNWGSFIPVFNRYTHKLSILRHYTYIVYISISMLIWNVISVKRYINTRKRYIPAYSKVVILTIVLEKDDWWQTRTQCLYLLLKVQHVVMNYFFIGVVMVSMLTLSVVMETKDFNVSFYCFSTKHTTLRSKIRIMIRCQSEVTCLPVNVKWHVYLLTVVSVS
jgi:hypothetical protein